MGTAEPLARYPLVRSQSIDEMHRAITQVYTRPQINRADRNGPVDCLINYVKINRCGLAYSRYGTEIDIAFADASPILQIFPIRGKGEALVGGTSASMVEGSSVVVSSNMSYRARCDSDFERLVLHFEEMDLTRKLSAIADAPIRQPIRFDPAQDFKQPGAQILRSLFLYMVEELSTAAEALPALVLAEMEEALTVAFLCANRHNYSHLMEGQPRDLAPRLVRRAEEYIEANWNRPIVIEDLAAVTGASARNLFRTFKQAHGFSPMDFVRQVRLRRAKQMLERPEAGTTVTDVARACGFGDLGRFGKEYRRSFGQRPSDTLWLFKGGLDSRVGEVRRRG